MNQLCISILFFVSGFCSLVYQVVWTRLAFASFGVITPVISVVISVFMLGLALGSWVGGKWISRPGSRDGRRALFGYAAAEGLIGLGGWLVPGLFDATAHALLSSGEMGSVRYLGFSALGLTLSILPWCLCMGATFPLILGYLRSRSVVEPNSFSLLYVPNVLGAMAGTLLTAFILVELLGFNGTLRVAIGGNVLIAIAVLIAAARPGNLGAATVPATTPATSSELPRPANPSRGMTSILFWTGFASMGMEVVWIRSFAPVIKTQVYSFALILATYLGATFIGAARYRVHLKRGVKMPLGRLLGLLCIFVLAPVWLNDARWIHADGESRIHLPSMLLLLGSLVPFCALLGYLTPNLIDQYSGGEPRLAGRAYAVNVVGCILGPLVVSYVILPYVAERVALVSLSLPLFALYWLSRKTDTGPLRRWGLAISSAFLLIAMVWTRSYEDQLRKTNAHFEVRRDYAASVVSYGEGGSRRLLVNGVGMSVLTPITKCMTHLPLAFHGSKPKSALIICFGMGTSYRSALSWGLETTAVELVPGVREAFGFYHADAPARLHDLKGRILIDDGRRFLARTREKFDLIVVDPPPPVEAAGSSLFYSTEFYALARQRLNPGGLLQAWIPLNQGPTLEAVARSIQQSFPYVRCFGSVQRLGRHFLASDQVIPPRSAQELAERFPAPAAVDLLEWNPESSLEDYLTGLLGREIPFGKLLTAPPEVRITDNQPYNEYFVLRGRK